MSRKYEKVSELLPIIKELTAQGKTQQQIAEQLGLANKKVVWNLLYRERKKGFEETGEQVVHFCLMAKREVIHERLTRRGDEPDSWAFHQTEKCLASFENDPKLFKKLIFTNTADQYEVVQTILDNI